MLLLQICFNKSKRANTFNKLSSEHLQLQSHGQQQCVFPVLEALEAGGCHSCTKTEAGTDIEDRIV